MFKKHVSVVLMMTLVLVMLTGQAIAQAPDYSLNVEQVHKGVVGITYDFLPEQRVKFMVDKDGQRYFYDLSPDNLSEQFALQMGDGMYRFAILENTEGNRYRFTHRWSLEVEVGEPNAVYLNSIQNIKWDDYSKAVILAHEITIGLESDVEKLDAIYGYVIETVQYDYQVLRTLASDYLPNVEQVLEKEAGICYDYASLLAIMLRSVGIPTKMVMGYTENAIGYHAWNSVYLSDDDTWITVDATYDAQMLRIGRAFDMIKESDVYQEVRVY